MFASYRSQERIELYELKGKLYKLESENQELKEKVKDIESLTKSMNSAIKDRNDTMIHNVAQSMRIQELKSQVEKLTEQIEKMRKDNLITINCIRIDLVGDNWIVNKNKEFSISVNSNQLISLRSDVDDFGTKFTVIHYKNESGEWINRTLEDIENLTKRFNGI